MSLAIVRLVSQEHPELLAANIGRTCYQHTVYVIEALRAAGREAFPIAKSPGEGQYTPPGFQRRIVIGLDGKEYLCSGVSHDAIWCDGKQYDTLGSANDLDRPIYRTQGPGWESTWSLDPTAGPQIVAHPAWNEIDKQFWRPNNPPLKNGVSMSPVEPPAPPKPTYPTYEELGGDEGAKKITRVLEADYKRAGRPGLDGDCGGWLRRTDYDVLTGKVPTVEASIARHRKEWCDALGIPVE